MVSVLPGGGGRRYFWEVATLSGGRYFQDLLAATKIDVIFGGSLSELYSKFSKPSSIVAGSKKWLQAVNLTSCHLIRRTLQSIVKNVKLCALENTLYSRKNLLLADENN